MTTTTQTVSAFIGGVPERPDGQLHDEVPNPASGEVIADLIHSSPEQIGRAIAAAGDALPAWADTPVPERAQVMFRFKHLLDQNFEEMAQLVTRENGKTIEDARGEVRRGIEVVDFACGAPTLLMGPSLRQISRGIDEELARFPVGVVAGITPFNFPCMVPLWMIPIALVCGNTFVLKPSQLTPLSALRLAELLSEAGLPRGAFNVIHGAKEAVDTLLTHPGVAAVSFVGSATVAAHVHTTASAHGKRVQALGGAKNHLVVMDDADLEHSVPAMISSAFGAAGQRCLAGSVAVGVGRAADALVSELSSQAQRLKVGPGSDPSTQMGPVIRAERRQRLVGYIEEAERDGARLVTDGRGLKLGDGFFLGPTIFDHVKPSMRIWQDELFGPVLSVVRASDIDEAIALINSSTYGNMASIFTSKGRNAREFTQRVEAGMLGVNIGVAAPMAYFPFTGWKRSFLGDLHATGTDGVRFYTRQKVVTSRWF